jgi:hypothetical protein
MRAATYIRLEPDRRTAEPRTAGCKWTGKAQTEATKQQEGQIDPPNPAMQSPFFFC